MVNARPFDDRPQSEVQVIPDKLEVVASFCYLGDIYSPCVWSAMLYASETLPLTKTNLQRLQHNNRAMIRHICSTKSEDMATVRSSELLAKLELEDLDLILREKTSGLVMWSILVVQSE